MAIKSKPSPHSISLNQIFTTQAINHFTLVKIIEFKQEKCI